MLNEIVRVGTLSIQKKISMHLQKKKVNYYNKSINVMFVMYIVYIKKDVFVRNPN